MTKLRGLLVAVPLVLLAACVGGPPVREGAGALDGSFTASGTARIGAPGTIYTDARAVAVDAAGRTTIAGQAGRSVLVARLTPDGRPDPTFGARGTGVVVVPVATYARADALALTPDGGVVVAGTTTPSAAEARSVVLALRLRADGSLDPGFGAGGIATVAAEGASAAAAVALTPDGQVVLAGSTELTATAQPDVAVVRLDAAGRPDPGFGGDGVVTIDATGNLDVGSAVVVDGDGGVVVGGTASRADGDQDVLVLRLRRDGTRDAGFGGEGGVRVLDAGSRFDQVRALARRPDGRLVAAGVRVPEGLRSEVLLVGLTAAGGLDPAFGAGGLVGTHAGEGSMGHGLRVDAQGRILVAGRARDDALVARYLPDGRLDEGFGTRGAVLLALGTGVDTAFGVALDPQGRAVVSGCTCSGAGSTGRGGIEIPSQATVTRVFT